MKWIVAQPSVNLPRLSPSGMLRDGAGDAARFSRVWVLVKLGCGCKVGGQVMPALAGYVKPEVCFLHRQDKNIRSRLVQDFILWYTSVMLNQIEPSKMNIVDSLKVDRAAFSIISLSEETDEKAYWLSKTPYERLQSLEWMRQVIYGYSPSTTRLQRVLTIAQFPSS